MDDNGLSIVVGGGALGALSAVAAAWLRARVSARRPATPVPPGGASPWAERENNDRAHEEMARRISSLEQRTAGIDANITQILARLQNIDSNLHKLIMHLVRVHGGEE